MPLYQSHFVLIYTCIKSALKGLSWGLVMRHKKVNFQNSVFSLYQRLWGHERFLQANK